MNPKLLQHIKNLARNSIFYVCEQGVLRIEDLDEDADHFDCVDEDTGLTYEVPFDEVDIELDMFQRLQGETVLENFSE